MFKNSEILLKHHQFLKLIFGVKIRLRVSFTLQQQTHTHTHEIESLHYCLTSAKKPNLLVQVQLDLSTTPNLTQVPTVSETQSAFVERSPAARRR